MADDPQLFDVESIERALAADAARLKLPHPKSSVDEARTLYGWTVHKLDVLGLYLKLYRRVAGGGTYLDGFAGEGRIRFEGEDRPGSAAVALQSGAFRRLIFYERPAMAAKLQRWIDDISDPDRARCLPVRAGDFNELVIDDLHDDVIPIDRPCFAFVDPDSTQCSWSTIEALAAYKADCSPPETCKVELWVLLNTFQVLKRLMPGDGEPDTATLDRWLGVDAWRPLYLAHASPGRFAHWYARRLVDELGYGAAVPLLIRDPKTRRPQYHMIHASDHRAAHGFMRWAANRAGEERFETPQLPGM